MQDHLRRIAFLSAALLIAAGCDRSDNAASAQPAGSGMMGGQGAGMMGSTMTGSAARHGYAMMSGIPEPYASVRNTLASENATLARGAAIYQQNCAACHGPTGQGDGPAAGQLNPRPANLGLSARMPMTRSDAYLDWTISEGGQKFGTAMPAFKQTLSSEKIWAVITYLQAGLPKEK